MAKKLKSRWGKGGQRYGSAPVESSTWVKDPNGGHRHVRKSVTEILFVQTVHEAFGWRNGARVRKI